MATGVFVVHGSFDELGGAELYCFRVIELLQRRFNQITVLHSGRELDFAHAARWSNIALDAGKVKFQSISEGRWARFLHFFPETSLSQLRWAFSYRRMQKFVRHADLLATTGNECSLKSGRIIQSIHFPQLVSDRESLGYLGWSSNSDIRYLLQVLYIAALRFLVGWDRKYIGSLTTITNSCWTAEQFRKQFPSARKVYPIYFGVEVGLKPGDAGWFPFAQRENNFVILGRVTPAKRTLLAVEIVSRLRTAGHDVGLHIVGKGEGEYAECVSSTIADKSWASWHKDLGRAEMEALLVRQKWGLHCCIAEHYGFAPAEMQALGCITFVHDSGGQREIVPNDAQRYRDTEDAVLKIQEILNNSESHNARVALAADAARSHTVKGFQEQFLLLLDDVMTQPKTSSALEVEVGKVK